MAEKATAPPAATTADADSDPDFDDLDDVLDQFSANAPTTASSKPEPQSHLPSSSGPGRPVHDIPIPSGQKPTESQDEFLSRLTDEMSNVMSQLSNAAPIDSDAAPEDLAVMGQQLEDFTQKMEAQGIQPEDLLKAILGEEAGSKVVEGAHEDRERRESESQSKSRSPEAKKSTSAPRSKPSELPSDAQPSSSAQGSFEETIRRTMERLDTSSAAATSSSQSQQKSEEDMLADMLRGLSSAEGGDDGDLSKMFLGMMEQLTNKDMLYEPMAELHQKFPQYLEEHKATLPPADYSRYQKQQAIVSDMVNKFEEKGYSDDDPKCREFIWEKMQAMQEQGAPPEDLVANPLPGMGLGGKGMEGLDEGCPTQ